MTVIVPCSCMTVPSTYVSTHDNVYIYAIANSQNYNVAASIITGSVSSTSIFITFLAAPRAVELTICLSLSLSCFGALLYFSISSSACAM